MDNADDSVTSSFSNRIVKGDEGGEEFKRKNELSCL